MDVLGIRAALQHSIAAARFRFAMRPIEHTAKVDDSLAGVPGRRRRKQRFPNGSWVVTLSGGFVLMPGPDTGIARSINDTIKAEVDRVYGPALKERATVFNNNPSAENLLQLEHIFKNFDEARNVAVARVEDRLSPAGNAVVRFDTEDWEDGDAESRARSFTIAVNNSIDQNLGAIVDGLNKTLYTKVVDG